MKTRTYYMEKCDVEGTDIFDVHVISENDDIVVDSFYFEENAISCVATQMLRDLYEQEK